MTDRLAIAAFDVDGTLTRRDCVVPFVRRVSGTGRLPLQLLRRTNSLVTASAARDRDAVKAEVARVAFRGRAASDVERAAQAFARHVHEHWMRADVVERLVRHRESGDTIVLVSASFDVYLRPLAELLRADGVVATRLAVDGDGILTGELDGPNCRGPEKPIRLHRWLDERGSPRSAVHVTAYGDSAGDRDLLADADVAHWVGRGAADGRRRRETRR